MGIVEKILVKCRDFFMEIFVPITVVKPWERSIRVRGGKISDKIYNPGWYFWIPFVDQFYPIDIRPSIITLKDNAVRYGGTELILQGEVCYCIADPKKFYLTGGTDLLLLVESLAESTVLKYIMYTDSEEIDLSGAETSIKYKLQDLLVSYGVNVVSFNFIKYYKC